MWILLHGVKKTTVKLVCRLAYGVPDQAGFAGKITPSTGKKLLSNKGL